MSGLYQDRLEGILYAVSTFIARFKNGYELLIRVKGEDGRRLMSFGALNEFALLDASDVIGRQCTRALSASAS